MRQTGPGSVNPVAGPEVFVETVQLERHKSSYLGSIPPWNWISHMNRYIGCLIVLQFKTEMLLYLIAYQV
jgi:hypothetical protein